MGVLVAAAILFSFALACGMPFAALGALAALTLAPRDSALLASLGWLANQAIVQHSSLTWLPPVKA